MNKYWENEQPITADTGHNTFKYFQKAGKLQVSMPNWTNGDGEEKRGKTITIDTIALRNNPEALSLFKQMVG